MAIHRLLVVHTLQPTMQSRERFLFLVEERDQFIIMISMYWIQVSDHILQPPKRPLVAS
jgi:hypothetical protein